MTRKAHFNARVYRSSTSDVRGDIVETPWGVWVAAWSRLSFVTVKTGRGVELAAFRPTDSSKTYHLQVEAGCWFAGQGLGSTGTGFSLVCPSARWIVSVLSAVGTRISS